MATFELDDAVQDMVTMVQGFAAERFRANEAYRKAEKAGALPEALRGELRELGLHLVEVPEAAGGMGFDLRAGAVLAEELAYGDVGMAVAAAGFQPGCSALTELAETDEQAAALLAPHLGGANLALAFTEAGDPVDPECIATTFAADGDGYRLMGSKSFVRDAGAADAYVVLAKEEGAEGWDALKAFWVPGDTPGLIAGERLRTLGLETCAFADLGLMGATVPRGNLLPGRGGDLRRGVERTLHRCRVLTAAQMVGAVRAASDYAFKYSTERQAFGQPIKDFQGLAFLMADMATEVEAMRWLVWKAAWAFAVKEDAAAEVLAALGQVIERAQQVATDAVQVLGGHGFIQDHPVEKWMRDVRTLAVIDGAGLFWSHGLAQAAWERAC